MTIIASKRSRLSERSPIFSIPTTVWLLSRIRITTFSPNTVGMVLTRRSISRLSALSWIRPSWGSRRSAMSMSAMILSREMMAAWMCLGGVMTLYSAPSIR